VAAGAARPVAAALAAVGVQLDDWPACRPLLDQAKQLSEVVRLLDALEAARGTPALAALWRQHAPRLAGVQEAEPFRAEVELRDLADRNDWERIAGLTIAAGHALPADLIAARDAARLKVQLRDAVRAALAAGAARPVAAALGRVGSQLDDWPACRPLLDQATQVAAVVRLLDALQAARGTPALAALWRQHAPRLAGIKDAEPFRAEAGLWDLRNAALDALDTALKTAGADQHAVVAAWDELQRLGGHPDADRRRDQVELARRRARCLDAIRRLPTAPGEAADSQLTSLWDEPLLAPCAAAAALRPRLNAARARLAIIAGLQQAASRSDGSVRGEQAIVDAARTLPTDYDFRLAARVSLAREVCQPRPSERQIVKAWEAARASGGLPSQPALVERYQRARRCCDAMDKVEAIPRSLPDDEQDAQWLRLWDNATLQNCPDAATLLARYALASRRIDALAALRCALDERRPSEVARLLRLLDSYPPLVPLRPRIDAMIEDQRRLLELEAAIDADNAQRVQSALEKVRERDLLTSYAREFAGQRQKLERWLQSRVLNRAPIAGAPPYIREGPTRVRLIWTPAHPMVTAHRVSLDPYTFSSQPQGRLVSRESFNRAAGWPVELNGGRVYVAIWPVVGLTRTEEIAGPPLHIGPIAGGGPGPSAGGPRRR
jgi:hypothetical protein